MSDDLWEKLIHAKQRSTDPCPACETAGVILIFILAAVIVGTFWYGVYLALFGFS